MPAKTEQGAKHAISQTAPPTRHAACGGTGRPASRLDPVAAIDQDPCVAGEGRDVAGHRDHHGDLACRKLWLCACAPCRGGSNTTASKSRSSCGTSGRRNRSRASALTGFSPDVAVAAFCSAATAPASLSKAAIRAFAASRNANGPTPQNRSAMCLARPAMLRDQRGQRFFAGDGRLQERARRQRHAVRVPIVIVGRCPHQHQLAMPRQPRQAVLFGDAATALRSSPPAAAPSRAHRHRGRCRLR